MLPLTQELYSQLVLSRPNLGREQSMEQNAITNTKFAVDDLIAQQRYSSQTCIPSGHPCYYGIKTQADDEEQL